MRGASLRNGLKDGRLRAPVFLGLREDKSAEEVVRESAPDEPLFRERQERSQPRRSTARVLKFTNLDKVWFPNDGFTKRDILNYYDAVADRWSLIWRDVRCR